MQTTSTVATGNKGEVIAMHHLKKLGFEIVGMNYRFRHGEIDIVARDGETLVFCEVKMRMGDQFGEPEYAITQKKQQQIRKTARGYLYEHELSQQDCRFDVVTIRMNKGVHEINYIRNAF